MVKAVLTICASFALLTSLFAAGKPNVVFILADDLGVHDVGLYGSKFHETPNIDALAKRGVKFNRAYSASPLCSPTRSSIMTGLYPARTGITAPDCHLPKAVLDKHLNASAPPAQKALGAESVTRLATSYLTLAKAFKAEGYATAHFGKWHLGPEPFSPLQHGFDSDIPHTSAPSPLGNGFFFPFPVWKDHGKPGDNLEDLLCDEAVKFIEQHREQPFFLNYWAFEVHSPWQASDRQIDKYRAKADPKSLQRNPVYAGMIETLDEVVGRLVAALEKAGVLDNTVIVFTSDNGPYFIPNQEHMPAEFHHVPVTSAQPLRAGKGTIYEAGTRVPLVVVWPGKSKPGTETDALMQSTDFFPTFADLLGWKLPGDVHFDGISLRPVLERNESIRDEVFCHFPHSQAGGEYERMPAPTPATPASSVRQGDWKLIRLYCDNADQTDRHELYNLAADPGERHDLAAEQPELVKQLAGRLDQFLKDTGAVMPKPNPAYKRGAARAKPNVLFILTEDQGAQLSFLSTPGLQTPHMDALAKSGVYFRNAFVAYPVCSPSKACIYTSLHNHTNGILNNTPNYHKPADQLTDAERNNALYRTNRIAAGIPTLVEQLKAAGYYQGVTHKLHVAPVEKFPYDEFIPGENGQAVSAFIERATKAGKPWHLFFNVGVSHRPFPDSDKVQIRVKPAEVKLPAFLPDTPLVRQDWAEYLAAIERADGLVGEAIAALRASGQEKNTIIICLGGDHGPAFPHGKMTLFDLGLRVTLSINAPGLPHGVVSDALVSELDLAPTLLDLLGLDPWPKSHGLSLRPVLEGKPGAKAHDFIFAEISDRGTLPNEGMQERSICDGRWQLIYREKLTPAWRQVQADSKDPKPWGNRSYHEIVRAKDEFPEPFRILAEMDPQSLSGKVPALELYDLQSDPDEMHNLASDSAHRAELERLFAALKKWGVETHDTSTSMLLP